MTGDIPYVQIMTMIKVLICFIFITNFVLADNILNEQELNNYLKNVKCLVCQGQSVFDSNTEFSEEVTSIVIKLNQEGKTEEEISHYLISNYGEDIFLTPSFNKENLILWILPYFILILCFIFYAKITMQRNK